ncbi:Chromosome partitioning ATPase, Mrp family, contains Fe-S cluster [Lachnospiraceae bacterium]|nr:Chromosome partitioning ATPase, Mrp family, contains Fe-S cluster [Lachnospiraceae bacterium]
MNDTPETCTHNCSSCGSSCSQRDPKSLIEPANPGSRVKRVIGVVSGKGGVGKSLVTTLSAISANRMGYTSAVLDADITGPSIPRMFGIHEKAYGTEEGLLPSETENGIKLMSINLLLDDEAAPVAWRGPILSSAVKQFWSEVVWGDVDFMFVDMPPGTGDVFLTVCQSLPLDGIIVVTSPQELVSMIVEKAVNMAGQMDVPILGIIENMSYALCPDCGKRIDIFGKSHIQDVADKYSIPVLGQIPMIPEISERADNGTIEGFTGDYLDGIMTALKKLDA